MSAEMKAVREAVERCREYALAGDDETAHRNEKLAWLVALTAIAEGCEDPQAVARAALGTKDVEFSRWFA